MTTERAREIACSNYDRDMAGMTGALDNEDYFNVHLFWDFYDAVVTLFKNGVHDQETTSYVCLSYQFFLRTLVWHYDPDDEGKLENVPKNMNEYIDLLGGAVEAYLTGNGKFLDEKRYYLQR